MVGQSSDMRISTSSLFLLREQAQAHLGLMLCQASGLGMATTAVDDYLPIGDEEGKHWCRQL